jgi:hypothetical protein
MTIERYLGLTYVRDHNGEVVGAHMPRSAIGTFVLAADVRATLLAARDSSTGNLLGAIDALIKDLAQ